MVDKKQEHKANIGQKLAAAKGREERIAVVLQGTIDALEAKKTRLVADFDDEIAFMKAELAATVHAVEHGVGH